MLLRPQGLMSRFYRKVAFQQKKLFAENSYSDTLNLMIAQVRVVPWFETRLQAVDTGHRRAIPILIDHLFPL
jgi:hypothetical protein